MSEYLDSNSYPTEDDLVHLSTSSAKQNHREMLELVRSLWYYPDYVTIDGDTYTFKTGGWSGNESLIDALQHNVLFWSFCWEMSAKGGVHVFKAKQLPTR